MGPPDLKGIADKVWTLKAKILTKDEIWTLTFLKTLVLKYLYGPSLKIAKLGDTFFTTTGADASGRSTGKNHYWN